MTWYGNNLIIWNGKNLPFSSYIHILPIDIFVWCDVLTVVTEDIYFLGCNAMHSVDSRACCLLHAGFCLDYSSTLNMEVACSFKMLVDFHRSTQCCILKDRTLQFTGHYPLFPMPYYILMWLNTVEMRYILIYITMLLLDRKESEGSNYRLNQFHTKIATMWGAQAATSSFQGTRMLIRSSFTTL